MASFPQPCGQDAYRDGISAVAALSRQGLDAQGTVVILHSAGAVVTPAVAQCLGAWNRTWIPAVGQDGFILVRTNEHAELRLLPSQNREPLSGLGMEPGDGQKKAGGTSQVNRL